MKLRITCILIFVSLSICAQNREHAYEVNNRLGRGINYGNMFEAPTETAWGNQWRPEYAGIIADLGFNHVRIPIRWETAERSSSTSPYLIESSFLERIKVVVDSALNNNLHAIINMHHHEALYENPEEQKARFLAQWEQISSFFKDYSDSLLFEILNEPRDKITPEVWNELSVAALSTIRQENPTRIVLIGTAEYGGLGGLDELQIPDDENIIVTVHYYNPFEFTHQGAEWVGSSADAWLGTKWNDSEAERQVVQNEFAPLVAFEKNNKVPVHIGEFGAYAKADDVSRGKWTTYVARYLDSLNFSWAYWEFSAGFGIYDKDNNQYRDFLVDALLKNPIPEPALNLGSVIYESDFELDCDDWVLQNNATASSQLLCENNALQVAISDAGSETWHVQLNRKYIALSEGQKYSLSFIAKAESTRTALVSIGMTNDPWTAYSDYNRINVNETEKSFSVVFDAPVDDENARISIDLGTIDVDFTIADIKLEEVIFEQETNVQKPAEFETLIYPIPAKDYVVINNLDDFTSYAIINTQGKILKNGQLGAGCCKVEIASLPFGIYVLKLMNEKERYFKKVLIE